MPFFSTFFAHLANFSFLLTSAACGPFLSWRGRGFLASFFLPSNAHECGGRKKAVKKEANTIFREKKEERPKKRVFSSFFGAIELLPPPPHFGGGGGSSCRRRRMPPSQEMGDTPPKKLFPFFSLAPPAVAVGSRERGGGLRKTF